MKHVIFTLIILFASSNLRAQTWRDVTNDFIVNPSFELFDTCPTAVSTPNDYQINHCLGWTTPTYATSDYFNSCAGAGVSVPSNGLGFQNAFDGGAYLGFLGYSYYPADSIWCEYVQSRLNLPLIAGRSYRFSMRVNFSTQWQVCSSRIGAHFSTTNMQDYLTTAPFNISPSIMNNTGFICDTTEWRLVSGEFTATGNEQYITIGWFGDIFENDYAGTLPVYIDTATGDTLYNPDHYYFVDSLKLYEQSYALDDFNINVITPNGDQVNDAFDFTKYNLVELQFVVYNRWGNVVFQSSAPDLIWTGTATNGKPLSTGTYYYIIDAIVTDGGKIQRRSYLSIFNP